MVLDREMANIPAARVASDVYFFSTPLDGNSPAVDRVLIRGIDVKATARQTEDYFEGIGYSRVKVCEPICHERLGKEGALISVEVDEAQGELRIEKLQFPSKG